MKIVPECRAFPRSTSARMRSSYARAVLCEVRHLSAQLSRSIAIGFRRHSIVFPKAAPEVCLVGKAPPMGDLSDVSRAVDPKVLGSTAKSQAHQPAREGFACASEKAGQSALGHARRSRDHRQRRDNIIVDARFDHPANPDEAIISSQNPVVMLRALGKKFDSSLRGVINLVGFQPGQARSQAAKVGPGQSSGAASQFQTTAGGEQSRRRPYAWKTKTQLRESVPEDHAVLEPGIVQPGLAGPYFSGRRPVIELHRPGHLDDPHQIVRIAVEHDLMGARSDEGHAGISTQSERAHLRGKARIAGRQAPNGDDRLGHDLLPLLELQSLRQFFRSKERLQPRQSVEATGKTAGAGPFVGSLAGRSAHSHCLCPQHAHPCGARKRSGKRPLSTEAERRIAAYQQPYADKSIANGRTAPFCS